MKTFALAFAMFALNLLQLNPEDKTVYDFSAKSIDGKEVSLSQYKGKVLLIVNVASKCGHTPQYSDLQAVYDKYKDKGLMVLGFPANNFLYQEPGSNADIRDFCTKKYNVTFPMFEKIDVKGSDMHPLYRYLTKKSENGVVDAPVKWNFQKFLVGRDGKVIAAIAPGSHIDEEENIVMLEKALASE